MATCMTYCCADSCGREEVYVAKSERQQNLMTDERSLQAATFMGAGAMIPDFPTAGTQPATSSSFMPAEDDDDGGPLPPPPAKDFADSSAPVPAPMVVKAEGNGNTVAAQPAYTPPPSTQDVYIFQVVITKGSGGLGVDLSPHDMKTLLVGKVKQGAIMDWNAEQPVGATDHVMRGDRIIAVNGATGSADAVLATMRQDSTLTMTMRRRLLVVIPRLNCGNLELGLFFKSDESLIVERIEERSAVGRNNRTGSSDYEIRLDDELLEANGESEPAKILHELTTQRQFSLKLRRHQRARA